jgi:hypothetical protein
VTARVTAALDAAVLGARSARSYDLLPEGFAGTKRAHRRVRARDSALVGKILHRQPIDVDPLEYVGVLGLEVPGQPANTLTDRATKLVARRFVLFHFGSECGEAAARDVFAAAVIDNGVAEQSVKPSDHCLAIPQLASPFDALGKRALQQVLGQCTIAHTSLEKREECAVVVHERSEDVRFSGLGVAARIHAMSLPRSSRLSMDALRSATVQTRYAEFAADLCRKMRDWVFESELDFAQS